MWLVETGLIINNISFKIKFLYFLSTSPSKIILFSFLLFIYLQLFKEAMSQKKLKFFSHELNQPGPLINRLKWFC